MHFCVFGFHPEKRQKLGRGERVFGFWALRKKERDSFGFWGGMFKLLRPREESGVL